MRRNQQKFPIQQQIGKQQILVPASPKIMEQQIPIQQINVPIEQVYKEDKKMEEEEDIKLDEKKEDINLDELENTSKKVNLDENSNKSKKENTYDLDDTIIRDVTLPNNIHFQLISNVNGYFIDIRKHYKGYPTKKGIRMLASKFVTASNLLKNDLQELIPSTK